MTTLAGLSSGTAIQSSQSPIVDPSSGIPTPEFYRWMLGLKVETAAFSAKKTGVTGSTDITSGSFGAQPGIPFNTPTKIDFPFTNYNQGGRYDALLSEWTPPAGLVNFTASTYWDGDYAHAGRIYLVWLYKNGAPFTFNSVYASTSPQFITVPLVAQDLANGSDVYSLWAYHQATVDQTIFAADGTFFMGSMQ